MGLQVEHWFVLPGAKPKVINIIEDPETVMVKCICAKTTCRSDDEQLELEQAVFGIIYTYMLNKELLIIRN